LILYWNFLGSGAYVCGEETALIESLEGHRGEPRNRPPYPINTGYLGRPTSVNNVETLAAVSHIAVKGGSWFAKVGTDKSTGSKLFSVSGDCEKPVCMNFHGNENLGAAEIVAQKYKSCSN
jgi:[NiFe] hydrogenase diaphorase moiety large subunit